MDNYVLNFNTAELKSFVEEYKKELNIFVDGVTEGRVVESEDGIMNIRNGLQNLALRTKPVWSGEKYNELVNYWNDEVAIKLEKSISELQRCTLVALQNMIGIYSSLDLEVGGEDARVNFELDNTLYQDLNKKIPLSNGSDIHYEAVSVAVFIGDVVRPVIQTYLPNAINKMNSLFREKLKGKSTSFDTFIEKATEYNNRYLAEITDVLTGFYQKAKELSNQIENGEEQNINDVNK